MAFDNSANFVYIPGQTTPQLFEKPFGISSIYFIVKGAGGAGGGEFGTNGGGGSYVFANYTKLNPDVSYNINIFIGGGGFPSTYALDGSGGISLGGDLYSNGGSGSRLDGAISGGGGGMTNLYYTDPFYRTSIIEIIAGGGGGGGSNNGASGGDGGMLSNVSNNSIGDNGTGIYGGQGGNIYSTGDGGLGGSNESVNGYDYIANVGAMTKPFYVGGGGGNGGSFAGGGGGAGYGGGAGGRGDGGGAGGSYSNADSVAFKLGEGGQGGEMAKPGENGFVQIYWNARPPYTSQISASFMLDAQHTCKSIYQAPSTNTPDPSKNIISNNNVENPYAITISTNSIYYTESTLYVVSGDGKLNAFNADFTVKWPIPFSVNNYTFYGTPAIGNDGTIYVSARTTSNTNTNYLFFAITDFEINDQKLGILKWSFQVDGNTSVSPVLDLSGNIFIGTDAGSIFAISDRVVQGLRLSTLWPKTSPIQEKVTGSPMLNVSYKKLCYTTTIINSTNNNSSSIYVLDVSNVTIDWSNNLVNGCIYTTPSLNINKNHVYVGDNSGNVYAYDMSNGNPIWPTLNVQDMNLSAIAVDEINNYIYFTSQYALNVVDSSNGILKWQFPINDRYNTSIPSNAINSIPTFDTNNNIYFGAYDTYLYCINGIDHLYKWRYKTGGHIQAMPIIGNNNNIYVSSSDGYLYDFSDNGIPIPLTTPIMQMFMMDIKHSGKTTYNGPSSSGIVPSKKWTYPFVSGNFFVSPSIAIASDGTIYVVSCDSKVYALDPNGNFKWGISIKINSIPNNIIYTTPVISTNGTIYIGSDAGYLFALNPIDGSFNRYYFANYPLESSPIIDSSNTPYFGAGNNVYAVADASYFFYEKWQTPFATGGHVYSSPVLGANGYLYFGSDDGNVYAVNSLDGTLVWRTSTNPILSIYTSPAIDISGNIFIGNGSNTDGYLYYLNGTTGAIIHQVQPDPMYGPYYNNVAINGDTVYLSTIACIYAFDRTTLTEKWKYINTNCYYSSPIIDASGTLFFTSIKVPFKTFTEGNNGDGILTSLTDIWPNTDSMGRNYVENWSIIMSTPGRLAPPVISSNRTIYVCSTDNNVYAVG